jgi:hypothetical protein
MLQSDLLMSQSDLLMQQPDMLMLQFVLIKLSIHLAYAMTLLKAMPYGDLYAFLSTVFIYTEVSICIATYAIVFDKTLVVISRK